MIKTVITATLLTMCATMLTAQPSNLLIDSWCDKGSVVSEYVLESGLKPLASGFGPVYYQNPFDPESYAQTNGVTVFFVDQDSKKFAVVVWISDNTTCVTLTGGNFEPYVE